MDINELTWRTHTEYWDKAVEIDGVYRCISDAGDVAIAGDYAIYKRAYSSPFDREALQCTDDPLVAQCLLNERLKLTTEVTDEEANGSVSLEEVPAS